jgi:hypothetical protein
MTYDDDRIMGAFEVRLRDAFLDLYRSVSILTGLHRMLTVMGKGAAYMPMTGETTTCNWAHVPAQTWVWENRLQRRA